MTIERFVEQTFAKKVRIVLQDEINCLITGLHPKDTQYFIEQYSLFVEGYFFNPKYKLGVWDGKKKFFSEKGKTRIYLLDEIIPKIKALGYKIEIVDNRTGTFVEVEPINETYFSQIINPKTQQPYILREYQVEAINSLIKEGFGIVIAGTGAGKTIINATLVDLYAKKQLRSITIVPNISLIAQTVHTFELLGLDVGEYSGTKKDINHTHVVSTWQSLQNNPSIISNFQVLVIDECHGAKANVISNLITEYGKNIVHRFGLTGTLPKQKADQLSVLSSIGPIRYEIAAHTLISSGWLAKPNITIIQLNDKKRLEQIFAENNKSSDGRKITYDSEIDFIQRDKLRLQWIADFIIEKASSHKGNVLCLVNSIKYGKKLLKLIPNGKFLHGKDDQQIRQQVYDLFETNNDLLVIATVQIAGVGLSIDRIFNLIFIDGGKSFVRTIQTIGRGLRKGKDKDYVDVVDICGNLTYSTRHMRNRISYYNEAKYKYKRLIVDYTTHGNSDNDDII